MPLRPRHALASLVTLGLAAGAGALTIDNFLEGPQNVVDAVELLGASSAPTFGEASGMSSSNTLRGVRLIVVDAGTSLSTPGTATATVSAATATVTATQQGTYSFHYDGVADAVGDGAFETTNGALNLNLTTKDRFQLIFANSNAPDAEFRITLWDANSTHNTLYRPVVLGLNEILFTEFGSFGNLDLSDIRAVRIQIGEVLLGGALTFTAFNAVPEPGSGLLLGLGLLGVVGRRRRRQSRVRSST